MAVVEISVVPIGTKSSSLSKYVAEAVKKLQQSGLKFKLTSMGTIIEGELNQVLETCKAMHESVFSQEVGRVVTTIKIDDRRDKESTMESKEKAVKEKLIS